MGAERRYDLRMYRKGERGWIRIGLLALIVLSPLLVLFGVMLLFPALNERKASGLLALFLLVAVPAMMLTAGVPKRGCTSASLPKNRPSFAIA